MARLSKAKFEALFGALCRLENEPGDPQRDEVLEQAFASRNPHLVVRAAQIVRHETASGFEAQMLAAYDGLFASEDPGCCAKAALAEALDFVDCDDDAPFLRGIGWVQLEGPAPQADVAVDLRARCCLALARLQVHGVLDLLADALADPQSRVRAAAAQAVGFLGADAGAPLLRLKLRLGDSDPEVDGEVLQAYLGLDAAQARVFASRLLEDPESGRRECAALAVGEARPEFALDLLSGYVARSTAERDLRAGIVALLMLRSDAATAHVRALARSDGALRASTAREALVQFGLDPDGDLGDRDDEA